MRRYVLVSGAFLSLLTCLQLLRVIMRWPVRVATIDVPLWLSGIAAVIVGSLAMRSSGTRSHRGSGTGNHAR